MYIIIYIPLSGEQKLIQGIDISTSQGNIDWKAVARSGIKFCYVKATEGSLSSIPREVYFDNNVKAAKKVGILCGAYHFFRSYSDSTLQADNFLRVLKNTQPMDLPPMVDIEINNGTDNSILDLRVSRWLEKVKSVTKFIPVIYTYRSFWNHNIQDDYSKYPLWIASYGLNLPSKPYTPKRIARLPNYWKKWDLWQYLSEGVVDGISGPVDLDLFNGNSITSWANSLRV